MRQPTGAGSRDQRPPRPAYRRRGTAGTRSRLGCGRGSGAPCGGIGEIATRIVGEDDDGNDDFATAAITEDDAIDDGMDAQEREDIVVELGIVDTLGPALVRSGV